MEKKGPNREFLRWLYKWFYKDTSEQAHLSSSLMMLSPFLLAEIVGGANQQLVENRLILQYHYQQVGRTTILCLAILSELNNKFSLGHDSDVAYIWTIFENYSAEAKDLLDQRYRETIKR